MFFSVFDFIMSFQVKLHILSYHRHRSFRRNLFEYFDLLDSKYARNCGTKDIFGVEVLNFGSNNLAIYTLSTHEVKYRNCIWFVSFFQFITTRLEIMNGQKLICFLLVIFCVKGKHYKYILPYMSSIPFYIVIWLILMHHSSVKQLVAHLLWRNNKDFNLDWFITSILNTNIQC